MGKINPEWMHPERSKFNLTFNETKDISFAVFENTIVFQPESRSIRIVVDDRFEDVSLLENPELYNGVQRWHEVMPDALSMEEDMLAEMQRIEGLKYSESDRKILSSRFSIDSTFFDCKRTVIHFHHPGVKSKPFNNALSGTDIRLSYGQGLLDFIYADFEDGFREAKQLASMVMDIMKKKAAAPSADTGEVRASGEAIASSHIQKFVDEYIQFEDSVVYIRPIIYRSLYTAICPPSIKGDSHAYTALEDYKKYLQALQIEYRDLVEFCFDCDFWPEVLGSMHAVDRYSLRKRIKQEPASISRTELFDFDTMRTSGSGRPYGNPTAEFIRICEHTSENEDRFTSSNPLAEFQPVFEPYLTLSDAQKEFAAEYDIEEEDLRAFLNVPNNLNIRYGFRTTADI